MIDQLCPFQCSTSVLEAEPVEELLTAKQLFALGHDTSFRAVAVEPGGLGLGETDHTGLTALTDRAAPAGRVARPATAPRKTGTVNATIHVVLTAIPRERCRADARRAPTRP